VRDAGGAIQLGSLYVATKPAIAGRLSGLYMEDAAAETICVRQAAGTLDWV